MAENYILLERTELNASAASVTFANIPQTGYTDLKIVASSRETSSGGVGQVMYISFNGSTASFSGRYLQGDGSTASSGSLARFAGLSTDSSATANTFANSEIYIPNYTSANNKSFSGDTVSENNATLAPSELLAGLWSNTAAITSITLTPTAGSFVANSTFSLYGIAALGTTPVIAPKAIGGNIIDFDGTNWIHTFTSSGTFTPLQGLTCDYLVIAGGGGGGVYAGGGGGAGGYLTGSSLSVSVTPYPVTVGSGGAGGSGFSNPGTVGNNSVFSSITSTGGGRGGAQSTIGGNGGSGGGAPGLGTYAGGAASPSGQGNAGGSTSSGTAGGSGGGGASAAGTGGSASGANNVGGAGGAGTSSSITGSALTRAGGGGGAGGGSGPVGAGGSGGGGAGGLENGANGTSGTVNTGGGGGGAWLNATAGTGGSGIVIIRYPA
jgi:hypothetical protein